jgi:hypothetical protein
MKKELPHIKSPGFKIPENYFETLEEQILDKIALQEMSSKQNPFQVPSDYFENNAEKAFAKAIKAGKQVKVIPLYKKEIFRYAVAVAAVVLLVVSVFQFQSQKPFTTDESFTYSTLIENDFIDLSLIDFEYLLTDEMLDDEMILSSLNKDEIEDYLMNDLNGTYLLYE